MFPSSCKLFEASGHHPIPFHQAFVSKRVCQVCLACLSPEPGYTALPAVALYNKPGRTYLVMSLCILMPFHTLHMSGHRHIFCCSVTSLVIALSHRLHLSCRCTLIDPRPQKLSKSQRKWLQQFGQHRPCVAADTKVISNTALVNSSDAETPAAGQGNDSPAAIDSSPGESASTAASTIQSASCAATNRPPDHTAAQEHLPASASALPPIDQPASDDNLTAGDAVTHATCSDLQDQAFKDITVDICSPQPASLEPALADPQPHPANPHQTPISLQVAPADAVMSFSRHGSAAAKVASLAHGPHGDEGHTYTHGGGAQKGSEDLRGSLSQQIQVTTGYQSVHQCKIKPHRSWVVLQIQCVLRWLCTLMSRFVEEGLGSPEQLCELIRSMLHPVSDKMWGRITAPHSCIQRLSCQLCC